MYFFIRYLKEFNEEFSIGMFLKIIRCLAGLGVVCFSDFSLTAPSSSSLFNFNGRRYSNFEKLQDNIYSVNLLMKSEYYIDAEWLEKDKKNNIK